MKSLIILLFLLFPTMALAQVGVPRAPSAGYFLVSTSTGNYITTTTDPLHAGTFWATSTTGTSTFANGLNLLTGCLALNGTCLTGGGGSSLSGGSPNTLTYWTSGTAVSATSSPTVGYITATTTTKSSIPYASSTAITISGALFDSLSVSGTAGYVLSSTGNALKWVATTTFSSPLSYSNGVVSCPTCNTSSLSGSGSPNTLTYWTSGSALSATSSPTVGYITATTTTASTIPYASSTALTLSGALFDSVPSAGTSGYVLSSTATGIKWTATTTFNSPLSYSNGAVSCSTCNTSSLSGTGIPNVLTYWTSTTNLDSTSSPTVNYIYASSTSATSTFLGGFIIGTSTGLTATPDGRVAIGSTSPVGRLEVHGEDYLSTNSKGVQLGVYNTKSQAIDTGGVIGLGGFSGSTVQTFGAIAGRKENTTGGNSQGYLAFFTRPSSGAMTTSALNITSTRNIGISSTSPVAKLSIAAIKTDTNTSVFTISSTTAANATTTIFNIDNSGSTTAANGVNITSGCFSINGACVVGGTVVAPSVKSLIPKPMVLNTGITSTAISNNTTMYTSLVQIPTAIVANKVTIAVQSVTTFSQPLAMALFSEDGATRYFSATTSIDGTGIYSATLSSISIPAGNYWFSVVTTGGLNIAINTYTTNGLNANPQMLNNANLLNKVAFEGTLTVASGTIPSTITPLSIASSTNSAVIFRLDN